MLHFIAFDLAVIMQLIQTSLQRADTGYLFETMIANGGIGAVLFAIWLLTFKHTQRQFSFALKQNQDQFAQALSQIEKQHKENLEESRRMNDKLFEVIRKDAEYKEVLTGVLTEMKSQLINHINRSH